MDAAVSPAPPIRREAIHMSGHTPTTASSADTTAEPVDRRRVLKTAGAVGAALWITPSVMALDASPAVASTCTCAGGATAGLQFLTQQTNTTPPTLPTACGAPTAGATSPAQSVCRTDSTQKIYLWGTGTIVENPNGPMFDDIGIVTVTDHGGVSRFGNIYRFQNFCRHGTNVPTTLVAGYAANVQRVWTGADVNTWDFLPPQPTSNPTETATPTSWWTASQPMAGDATTSVGNPGFTTLTPWPGAIDISLLFGNQCGTFTVTVADLNRYKQYKWSNIFIGTTPP
jgi:hypothetical protein